MKSLGPGMGLGKTPALTKRIAIIINSCDLEASLGPRAGIQVPSVHKMRRSLLIPLSLLTCSLPHRAILSAAGLQDIQHAQGWGQGPNPKIIKVRVRIHVWGGWFGFGFEFGFGSGAGATPNISAQSCLLLIIRWPNCFILM